MDLTGSLSQISQENPRAPSPPSLEEEELFYTFFDWPAYTRDTEPYQASSQDLDRLITEIPPLIHRFERMKTSFGSEVETATSSEYSSHPSPPELVLGEGSTSPSDHSGPALPEQPEDRHQPLHISLKDVREQDDDWTYPQADPSKGSQPGYVPRLRVPADAVAPHGPQRPNSKVVPAGRSNGKRQRQLENPEQTADVRKSGACLPCRLSRTRCQEHGVCPACRKAFPEHSHLVCARKNLAELWPVIRQGPDVWSRNPEKELQYCSQARRLFTGKPKPIQIFFSSHGSPALSAYVQPYRWQGEDEGSQLEKAAFSSEHPISHTMLQRWAEEDLEVRGERELDFSKAIRKFLMVYARESSPLPMVHQMACFFRIWKTPSFWCRDPSGKVVALPISVQAQLRTIVYRGIHSMEHDILKELDMLVTSSNQPKLTTDQKLGLWACLWQLILTYRDLTATSKTWLARSDRGPNDHLAGPIHARYRYLFESFFPLVAIFYHYQFRMKKSVEFTPDGISALRSKAIEKPARDLLDCRKPFLQSLQKSDNEVDQLLCILVVNHEVQKLNARKRAPKNSKVNAAAHGGHCEDGD
ncbi:hypothetical protein ACRE_073600 [Hapsidospora chrysogenum ATCC 11550]|uniref:Uncharacterized protein n=1 Tax=Hapsidospora chrysogenum (strain ATCC 11550 / CBS 779.69 / DSM 880 / IAM 14645 / JCM 23072 / IMI 49137) TaxID=857340 RepID=A0A086SXR9_HAPC1|nr:hypothetical protein ACRE_073600 [Hapsidospora chrysogenum ATCC 11550]